MTVEQYLDTEFNKLKGDWNFPKRLVPYGFGADARRTLKRVIKDFYVPFIIDQDSNKWGEKFMETEIVSPKLLKEINHGDKIVITIAKRRYGEIKKVLENYGFKENIDFCHLGQFIQEWYYRFKNEYCIFTLDIGITTACTLNCRYCNMFVPYHKKPYMANADSVKNDIDLLMNRVDYVTTIGILGGEALLNPELEKIIKYIQNVYSDRIGQLNVTTNAVKTPTDDMLLTLKKYDVNLSISDYTDALGKMVHADALKARADDLGITCNIMRNRVWTDVGFPEKPWDLPNELVRNHMMQCDPGWRGLADGKLYFCNCAWSAEKAGIFKLREDDCLDLNSLPAKDIISKKKVLAYCRGYVPNTYFSFCQVCGGCGNDNKNFVLAAEQKEKLYC